MSEHQHAEFSPIHVEVGVAVVAGGLSWLATPAAGVTMHWDTSGTPGWSMGGPAYAVVAAVLTFLMGHFITLWVSNKACVSYTWPAPVAAGVLWAGYAAFQRIWLGLAVFAAAAALAFVVYFVMLRLGLRGSASTGDSDSSEL